MTHFVPHKKAAPCPAQELEEPALVPPKPPGENQEHLGSSNAFEETENPVSRDPDDISDEKLDDEMDAD